MQGTVSDHTTRLRDPRLARFLFDDTRASWIWLIVRLYLGWQWLHAGYEKLTSSAWMDGGAALKGYWTNATKVPETGKPAIVYDWYRSVLTYMLDHSWYTWFAKLVAIGETAVGIALIIGFFTGIAAAFGLLMNTSYMLAGTASTNPVLGALAILLILAWKVAGWLGLDHWILPALGTPWQPGTLVRHEPERVTPEPEQITPTPEEPRRRGGEPTA